MYYLVWLPCSRERQQFPHRWQRFPIVVCAGPVVQAFARPRHHKCAASVGESRPQKAPHIGGGSPVALPAMPRVKVRARAGTRTHARHHCVCQEGRIAARRSVGQRRRGKNCIRSLGRSVGRPAPKPTPRGGGRRRRQRVAEFGQRRQLWRLGRGYQRG